MEFNERELLIIRNMFMVTAQDMIQKRAKISEVKELQELLMRFKEYEDGREMLQNN